MRIHHAIFFYCLIVIPPLWAQQEYTRGILLDSITREAVPFATIRIQGKATGVISNMDGGFQIPEKFRGLGDTLLISSMGYNSMVVPLLSLSPREINVLKLSPGVVALQEAILKASRKKPLTPRQIVQKAIESIPANYPLEPFSTIGYYRDYQLNKEQYLNLNEAIFEVFDQGFDALNYETTKVRIYDYKQNPDFERDTLALKPYDYEHFGKVIDNAYLSDYGGNEFTILQVHNALRNHQVASYSFVDKLDTDLLANHVFYKDPDSFFDGEQLFVIRFQSNFPNYDAYGKLYISKTDFAIHQMDYALYDDRNRLPGSARNSRGTRQPLIFEVKTAYKREAGNMFLNYISFHNNFKIWVTPVFRVEDISIDPFEGYFAITFNQVYQMDQARELSNYTIKYQGQKLKFRRAEMRNGKILLFPQAAETQSAEMFNAIRAAAKEDGDLKDLLTVEVQGIHDIAGNLINEWTTKDYQQYREFFVQEVKTRIAIPGDTIFMDKDKPIFKDQPIIKPLNFSDYWMNTPLPEKDQ